ncbi:MAG: aminotransferase class V-fold PLP-dependent enzyme [Bacteroidota bacterium]
MKRKEMLSWLASAPVLGAGWLRGKNGKIEESTGRYEGMSAEEAELQRRADDLPYRDFYNELGVRTLINATGTHTYLGGSLMLPEVVQAIQFGVHQYVNMNEFADRVGERLAELCRAEAAMVTAGAASALTLGTAAVLTGKDPQKIHDIPNLPGPRAEVIVQRRHRYSYDHGVRNTGIRFVEVETVEELEAAVNERTAMMLFMNAANYWGEIRDETFLQLGKKHGIPVFIDCAADVPPKENLWKYNEMGFDLVTISGGKGLRGPQSTGLLTGRKDLIEAARLNHSPNSNSIGRGMKVNKEEMLGLLVAVEQFLNMDEEAWRREQDEIADSIRQSLSRYPQLETEIIVQEIGNHFPQVRIDWDEDALDFTHQDLIRGLREGHPSIETATKGWLGEGVFVCMAMARPGQERVVSRRLNEIFDEVVS